MAKKTHNSPEAARDAILDAAQKMVVEVGPAGLRISAVAKAAGMAHPNIIHHFGSREGLIHALAERTGERATERIAAAITEALSASDEDCVAAMTRVLDTAYQGEEGIVAVWLHFSGAETELHANMRRIVELSHQLRERLHADVDYSNTNRLVMLVTLALVGEVVSGAAIKEALGFGNGDSERAHFRQWLAEILINLSDAELATSLTEVNLQLRVKNQ
ncbi:MAG: TetR/AcrR family transcriptional regulator [Gammaproteobacteria bacterium]|nr:TetR/AcrR family transcriptional regulator [Gammaproteobacteria bacterium]